MRQFPEQKALHGSNPKPLMSALGQKQTFRSAIVMSALPPKADIAESDWHVRFVPKADICSAAILPLFDHLIGASNESGMVRPRVLTIFRLSKPGFSNVSNSSSPAGSSPNDFG